MEAIIENAARDTLKTLEQEGDTKVPEDTDLQDLQEEAQGLTTTNTREEEQQKAANLPALKTLKQEGDTKMPKDTDLQNLH